VDIYSLMYEKLKLKPPIKIGTLFSGIGTPEMALKRITSLSETVFISEIDPYALKSYNAIHGNTLNLGSVQDIESLPYVDILHASPPCQDLSKVGKRKGAGKGTRSGLLHELPRIIRNTTHKPRVITIEQVPDLLAKEFSHHWRSLVLEMEDLGYTIYAHILNAKNYGVPQSRNRLYGVFVLGKYSYIFPNQVALQRTRDDYLEPHSTVDKRVWLSENMIHCFMQEGSAYPRRERFLSNILGDTSIVHTITTREGQVPTSNYILVGLPTHILWSKIHHSLHPRLKMRRLTEREMWRYMGIGDDDFDKASQVIGSSQLRIQAGNAIVVDVFEAILREMIEVK